MLIKFRDILLKKLWDKKLDSLPKTKRCYYKTLKIFWISIYNFFKHQLVLRASALTYFSLMAVVPFFALIFVIAKKIGYQEKIEAELIDRFQDQQEIINKIVEFAKNLIIEAKGGLIALVGVIFLFWSLIKVLSNLEESLNEIWQVKKIRTFKRRLSNYLAFMIILPVFLVLFVSLKIYILTFFSKDFFAQEFFDITLNILPYFLILALFTFIYIFMPRTKVKFKYAFYSAIISSIFYQLIQSIYVNFQIGITKFNTIYGSFAALPLFLIWLQISWLIFLFGAEMNYAFQNLEKIKVKELKKNKLF
jgi:membrane protein